MNNFWTRSLTGAVFVVVMVGGIWWNYWSMTALFFLISILGLWEFYSLVKHKGIYPQKIIGIFLGISVLAFFVSANRLMDDYMNYSSAAFIFLVLLIIIAELFRNAENPFSNIAFGLFGVIYITIPFAALTIPSLEGGLFSEYRYIPNYVLGYFFLLWSNDTFAYLVGRAIGKRKLFERISPKKTWEGTMGGILCTQGIALLLSVYYQELEMIQWMILGLIVSVFGTLGDLVESMFKRSLGVKDSGSILPGHGGILDRFDGVFLSSPIAVTYLMMIR